MSIGTKVLFLKRGVLMVGRVVAVCGARLTLRYETRGGLTEECMVAASEVAA